MRNRVLERKRFRLLLHIFFRSVVRLSVVGHSSAPCLNRSTDVDAIRQLHLWGPMRHCARWECLIPQGKGRFEAGTQAKASNWLPVCIVIHRA